MLIISNLIEEIFEAQGGIPEILHVDLSFLVINEIKGRSRDTKFSDSIHIFAFLMVELMHCT